MIAIVDSSAADFFFTPYFYYLYHFFMINLLELGFSLPPFRLLSTFNFFQFAGRTFSNICEKGEIFLADGQKRKTE